MKRVDRWLLRWLIRRNSNLIDDLSLTEQVAAARAAGGMTRGRLAELMGARPEWVLAFDLGVIDPHLSCVRRYAHASNVLVRHAVIAVANEENQP